MRHSKMVYYYKDELLYKFLWITQILEIPIKSHILTIYDITGNKVREEQVSGRTIIERKNLKKGVYVIGFYFPVVPKGKARIRVQLSSIHSIEQIDKAVNAFTEIGRKLEII